MRRVLLGCCVAALLLVPGCFSTAFDQHSDTKVAFVCRVLDGVNNPVLTIHEYGKPIAPTTATSALSRELQQLSNRSQVLLRWEGELQLNEGEDIADWFADRPFFDSSGVHMYVVWFDDVPVVPTGWGIAPGKIAISVPAIKAGAEKTGATEQQIATALLLHHAGHGLGLVNNGVPVQNPAIQEREPTPGHSANRTSIMHVGWEDPETMSYHGPYSFSAEDRRDWAGAQKEVCR